MMNKQRGLYLVFFLLLQFLTGCIYESLVDENGGAMQDAQWVLQRMSHADVTSSTPVSLMVDGNAGRISGFSGCNRYFGRVRLTGANGIAVEGVGSTKKMCFEAAAMATESRYLEALSQAQSWSMTNGRLVITTASGNLEFVKGD